MSRSTKKIEDVSVTIGNDNVLEDLGFESADEMLAEALLSHQIYKILKRRKLSQHQAAQLTPSEIIVSAGKRGRQTDAFCASCRENSFVQAG